MRRTGKNGRSKYSGKFKKGQIFGEWTVQKSEIEMDDKSRAFIFCQCKCGHESQVACHHILKGKSTRCDVCNNSVIGKGFENNPHWKGEGLVGKNVLTTLSSSAQSKGIPYDLTISYANALYQSSENKCYMTNTPISLEDNSARLATLNPEQGYVPGNVAWVHKSIEPVLRKVPANQFIAMCVAVADKYKPKE